jgi:hypothetical protein
LMMKDTLFLSPTNSPQCSTFSQIAKDKLEI